MRLIDGDALKHEICNIPMCGEHEQFYAIVSEVIKVLIAAPTVDPARHARWVRDDTWRDLYFCSACIGRDIRNNPNYRFCPDCGARMDAEVLSKMETTTEDEKDG